MNHESKLQKLIQYVLLYSLACIFIVPFFWILQTSFKSDDQIFAVPPKLIPVRMSAEGYREEAAAGELSAFEATWGYGVTLHNYKRAFTEFPFFRYLLNTTVIVVFSVLGNLLSCAFVGYAFACLRWPDRNALFLLVMATMLLPYQVTLIPVFILFRNLGWVDTLLPLIVPQFMAPPFFVFLLRQFFISIPSEMLEAGRIDGASELRIMSQIVLPLSKPALLTVGIFSAMFAWNDFLGPLIYLNSEKSKTLAVGLQSMVSQYGTEWGLLMAAGVVMIVPVLILFFFAQRYFIEGITLTGTKG